MRLALVKGEAFTVSETRDSIEVEQDECEKGTSHHSERPGIDMTV